MPKAIKITEDNKDNLVNEWALEEDQLDGYEGLFLVADFAATTPTYGYLNSVALDKKFIRTGAELTNDYFEVSKRS